jgi:NADH-quinone oxidoreductase subunit G
MATVYVNDKPVDIGNDRLNCIQAAERAGVFIPHYCWHEALTVVASCRMCLVEVGERKPDGTVVMPHPPKVVPGCQTPVKDGTVICTGEYGEWPEGTPIPQRLNYPAGYHPGAMAKKTQADTLEGLLLNHPLDCPVCDKAGECTLQDFSYDYGYAESRMIDKKNTPANKDYIGDNVTLFTDRCIMCSRCVRFTREISGTSELHVINRSDHSEIDIFPGEPLNNKLATNVVDLCPVGALCSKDFLYSHRVWNLKTVDSVCADCSTGCSINVDGNKNIVFRLRPRHNPKAQGHFMCDDGRLGYHYVNSTERILAPIVRTSGKDEVKPYAEGVTLARQLLTEAAQKDAHGVYGVLSPFLTCEEAYLLARFLKGTNPGITLALGPVPVVGTDDKYPKDHRGQPREPVKFTIRAEKCPNRKGVEAVLKHFQGSLVSFDDVIWRAGEGKIATAYFALSTPPRPFTLKAEQVAALQKIGTLIVQDVLPGPLSALAKLVLPGGAFAEKDGTFVNHAGLAQALHRAVTPTGECRVDGQTFMDLARRPGLFHAATVRAELAAEVPAFAPLAGSDLGEYGINLQV